MHPAGFEPAVPTTEWPQTHAFDRAAFGIGKEIIWLKSEPDMDSHKEESVILQLMYEKWKADLKLRSYSSLALA